jgi:hypothetical protein
MLLSFFCYTAARHSPQRPYTGMGVLQNIQIAPGCGCHIRLLRPVTALLAAVPPELRGLGVRGASEMTFKVYSGPVGTDAASPIDKSRMLFKEFSNFDEALSWAGHIKETGRVAVLIEDETGRTLGKREIAAALVGRDARDVRGALAQGR